MHMAQLMPLPLTVSCFSKIQIGFTFLVPAHPGSPRKRPLNMDVCVCVHILCHKHCVDLTSLPRLFFFFLLILILRGATVFLADELRSRRPPLVLPSSLSAGVSSSTSTGATKHHTQHHCPQSRINVRPTTPRSHHHCQLECHHPPRLRAVMLCVVFSSPSRGG